MHHALPRRCRVGACAHTLNLALGATIKKILTLASNFASPPPLPSTLFRAGFLALPWLWGLNAWLWHGSDDPVVRQCE